uniref:Uncharacterized protein n=1 Tax=Arundo donax TaxID=35708 RepID=A0A0A9H7W1_ARUDO
MAEDTLCEGKCTQSCSSKRNCVYIKMKPIPTKQPTISERTTERKLKALTI